jgi:hypothetical protein
MICIENIICQSLQDEIETVLSSDMFPWYYNKCTNYAKNVGVCIDNNTNDSYQFTHNFFSNNESRSDHFNLILPIILELEKKTNKKYVNRIFRIKANMLCQNHTYDANNYNIPHKDMATVDKNDIESLLYYVNDSDGDTFLFNEYEESSTLSLMNRISPKKGRSILFDSSKFHASSPPKNHKNRIVINFVFHNIRI